MSVDTVAQPMTTPPEREVWVSGGSVESVRLQVAIEEILLSYREGNNLILELADGRSLVVQDYFRTDTAGSPALLVNDGNSGALVVKVTEAGRIISFEAVSRSHLDEMLGVERTPEAVARVTQAAEITQWDAAEHEKANLEAGTEADAAVGGSPLRTAQAVSAESAPTSPVGETAQEAAAAKPASEATVPAQAEESTGEEEDGGWWLGVPGGGAALLGGVLLLAAGSASSGGAEDRETPESALRRILSNPDSLTAGRALVAGLDSVTESNLKNLRTVLEAELDEASGALVGLVNQDSAVQRQRLQVLIDTVNEAVDSEGGEAVLVADAGSLRLEIDNPSDGTGDVDRVVYIVQNELLVPSEMRIAEAPAQGTVDVAGIASNPDDVRHYSRIESFTYGSGNYVIERSIDDSGTPGESADGSVDAVESYGTPDADEKTAGITDPRLLRQIRTLLYMDIDGDGIGDRLASEVYDDGETEDGTPDGKADKTDFYFYREDGTLDRIESDTDGDGGLDRISRFYANGRLRTVELNPDSDDNVDERRQYFYGDDGFVEREQISEDTNDDGALDIDSTRYFDGANEDHVYTAVDGFSTSDPADGTIDRLEFVDGKTYALALTDDLAAAFAGLQAINFADDIAGTDGSTRLTISDLHLTLLADRDGDGAPDSGYQLVIAGEAGDAVILASHGFASAGTEAETGRQIFIATNGRVHVDANVEVVDRSAQALRNILADPSASDNDVAMYKLAGITTATSANLANVQAVLEAWDGNSNPMRTNLSLTQVQSLAEIADEANFVPSGAAISSAAYTESAGGGAGTLTLRIDTGQRIGDEREVVIGLAPKTYGPAGATVREDTDGDGAYDNLILEDADGDSNFERVATDADGDGASESVAYDSDSDGTVGYMLYDGTGTSDDDGVPDRLVISGPGEYNLALRDALAREFAGIRAIDLAGDIRIGTGRTTLTISDAQLTLLADGKGDGTPDSGYELVIDGGSDDRLVFTGNAIYGTGVTANGREEYQGTNGRVLVGPAVSVMGAVDPLTAVLRHLDIATLAMIEQTGLRGISSGNLENVRTTIGAFGAETTPILTSLTQVQIQGLVDIVNDAEIVPAGAIVDSAAWSGSVLTLGISTHSDPAIELSAALALNIANFAVSGATLSRDDDSDGTYETVATDAEADGNAETIAYDSNDDGTVDYILSDGTGTGDDDGTLDKLTLASGVSFHLAFGANEVEKFAGITEINLGEGSGEQSVEIDDETLTRLSDRDSDGTPDVGFVLTVNGASGALAVTDDQIVDATVDQTPAGYRALRGSHGTILLDSDIIVDFTLFNALMSILSNLGAATVELFATAAIPGVTSENLSAVKLVIGQWNEETTPPRESLTLAQVRALAGIITGEVAVVPFGGVLEIASLDMEQLVLGISTDGDGTVDQRVTLTLDSAAFAPTEMVRDVDADNDGTIGDRQEADNNFDGMVDIVTESIDINMDGTYETVATSNFTNGLLITRTTAIDTDVDGTRDEHRFETFGADGAALEELRVEINSDDDAYVVDRVTITMYSGDGFIETVQIETDIDDDGTADETQTNAYDATGRIDTQFFDDDADGTRDRAEYHTYLGSNSEALYTRYDGFGTDNRYDSTVDRLQFFAAGFGTDEVIHYDLTLDSTRSEVTGVREVMLPGTKSPNPPYSGVGVSLKIDDDALTALASPNGVLDSNYSFTVDGYPDSPVNGNVDDFVIIGDGTTNGNEIIYQTGGTDDQGRREYQGTNAKFYVGPDVEVRGALDPLAGVLRHLGEATLKMFELAGLTDVTEGNLENIKGLIGSFDNEQHSSPKLRDLTSTQVQGLIDIAGEHRVFGTDDSVISSVFAPAQPAIPFTQSAIPDRLVIGIDEDSDQTVDRMLQIIVSPAAFSITGIIVHRDRDGNGTIDTIEADRDYDGIDESIDRDINEDGTTDFILRDGSGTSDEDGTLDSVKFPDGVAPPQAPAPTVPDRTEVVVTAEIAVEFAGIDAIKLSGDQVTGTDSSSEGVTRLTLDDTHLTTMANGESGYELAIDGEANDSVTFNGGIYATGRVIDGKDEYQGRNGKVLVAQAVSVLGTPAALDAILDSLETDSREESVVLLNLYSTFNQTRVDSLTDAVDRFVPTGGAIVSASVSQGEEGALTLMLGIDSDDAGSSENFVVWLTLNDSTLASEYAVFDDNLDGRPDRTETDMDSNGTNEAVSTITYTDVDGDGTPEGRVELRYSTTSDNGTEDDILTERHDVTDMDDDGHFERRLRTIYAPDGMAVSELHIEYDDGLGGSNMDMGTADDGTVDHSDKRELNINGDEVLFEVDYDNNGTLEVRRETNYRVQANTRETETVRTDNDEDGTFETWRQTTYDAAGYLAVVERYEERGDDGMLNGTDHVAVRHFNSNGQIDRELVYSGTNETLVRELQYFYDDEGTRIYGVDDELGDGSPDAIHFYRDAPHFFNLKEAETGDFAGIGNVHFSGEDVDSTFRLSDDTLTALAGSRSGYTIVFHGADGGVLDLGGGIVATGGTDSSGRDEYQGSDGTVYVDSGVEVIRVLDVLEVIDGNRSAIRAGDAFDGTAYNHESVFERHGVNAADVDHHLVWQAVRAFRFPFPLRYTDISREMLETLIDDFVANEYVIPGVSRFITDTVRFEGTEPLMRFSLETFESDGVTPVDRRRVKLSLDDNLSPSGIEVDYVTTFSFFGRTVRRWFDPNFDSTAERQEFDLATEGPLDEDMDGTGDTTMDGIMDIRIYDNEGGSNDGTPDRLEFIDGNTVTLTLSDFDLALLTGITKMELAGNDGFRIGSTKITISDEDLTVLAGSALNYKLIIDGDGNDRVTLSGLSGATGDKETDEAGRNGYQGTDGIIFIDPDITVVAL